jgi:glycosyltransferase involved in cell wall biosynthesis
VTVIGVTMVKDEADVISATIAQLFAQGVDHIIAADNLSTDQTRSILDKYDRVTVIDDNEPGYYQDAKMTNLARQAHDMGADWVLPFDADEIWYGIDQPIAQALDGTPADVIMAAGWDHIVTTPGDQPFSPWRRPDPQRLSKVAFRATATAELNMGNHDVRGVGPYRTGGVLEYRHFQYRSLAQMTRKLRNGRAAYEASTVHELHGTHWREGGLLTDDEMAAKWDDLCGTDGLVFDPVPWGRP